ncbi:MAG: transporter substrate-binding domain-containing protein [Gammaproteobacteria bacterium]|nr:transporter substrate-binding domain-containing protein [Gammaproteobacteria bacterium]
MPRSSSETVRAVSLSVLLWCLFAILPAATDAASDARTSPELQRLLDLIEHRAHLMPDVARWKWQRNLPITDGEQEDAVLARSTQEAMRAGLDPVGAQALVAAQMAVARDIQQASFERFEQTAPPAGGPDLHTDLRRAINATTAAILATLPPVLPLLPERRDLLTEALRARLQPLGASSTSIASLAEALTVLRPAPVVRNTLERVLESGVLRIGTTLDYEPFSFIGADGEPDGIDVALGRLLAESLDVAAEFVTSSWPTLMSDFSDDRFDIGMSGISRTPTRARVAAFTAPYHTGGKTPIIRCSDRQRFDSLASIDQENVRAVVNPGGTNEELTRTALTRASIRIFDDNTRIFLEIAEDRADVMLTDAIEVRLQTARDPRLCAALPGQTLTFQEKGFMLPGEADTAWLRYVDLWLATIRGEGVLDELFERYLGQP